MAVSLKDLIDQARYHIERSPQAKFLPPERIDAWLEHVANTQPDAIVWLAQRLGSIGSSEIGALVQAVRNSKATSMDDVQFAFMSDKEIMGQKYLLEMPSDPEGQLLRGNIFEPIAAEMTYKLLKSRYKSVTRLKDVVQQIVNHSNPDLPWSRNQIDDVYLCDGKKIIVDYKVPSEQGLKTLLYKTTFGYECQLNVTDCVARNMEEPFVADELMLAVLDTNQCRIIEIPVERDLALQDEIVEVGNYYFDLMMKGEMPAPAFPHLMVQGEETLPNHVKDNLYAYASTRHLIKALDAQAAQHSMMANEWLTQYSKEAQMPFKISLGTLNLSGKPIKELDKEKAVQLLSDHMEPADVARIAGNKAKLTSALVKQFGKAIKDEPTLFIETFDIDFRMSAAKKGAQFELLKATDEQAEDLTKEMVKGLNGELSDLHSTVIAPTVPSKQKWQVQDLVEISERGFDSELQERADERLDALREHSAGNELTHNQVTTNEKESPSNEDVMHYPHFYNAL